MQRIGAFCSELTAATAIVIRTPCSIPTARPLTTPYGGSDWQYMPSQVNFSQVEYDRTRTVRPQPCSTRAMTRTCVATVQYMDSQYDNAWLERSSNICSSACAALRLFAAGSAFIAPRPVTPAFTFGADGMLESGVLTQADGRLATRQHAGNIDYGSAVPGLPFVNYCGCRSAAPRSVKASTSAMRRATSITPKARAIFRSNLRWDVNDKLRAHFRRAAHRS